VRAESRIAKAVTRMKFWFMGEIVTDGVGHLRTYGPRGQVKGGRGPYYAPNPLRGGASKGCRIKVGLAAKWGGFKVWI
jgi:hypothetical protein